MARNNAKNAAFGDFGETYIAGRIARMGIPVAPGISSDLTIWGEMQIECKIARLSIRRSNGDKGYQFSIEKKNSQTIGRAAFLICVCVRPHHPFANHPAFIIPASVLNGARKVLIPNRDPAAYRGKWAEFYNRWDLLEL